jgi:hypothetical protein
MAAGSAITIPYQMGVHFNRPSEILDVPAAETQ